MSKKYKPTEFSAHLSRSKMRKYLNNTLSLEEIEEVELHLKHCIHCSSIIVAYVEQEEPEHYKVHMAKLKSKLMSSVKPRKPKLTAARIKVIRAAAAVAALFVFSFFALGNMAKKDFNFISDAGKRGNELPELKTSQKSTQKPKASTSTLTEQKIDEVDTYEVSDYDEEEEIEEEVKPVIPTTKPKTQGAVVSPKSTEQKQEEQTKVVTTSKAIEKTVAPSLPTGAEAAVEMNENTAKEGEEKRIKTENQEEENKVEVVKTVQPLQKIEKIDVGTQNKVVPEAQNIPSNGVGQLRQR